MAERSLKSLGLKTGYYIGKHKFSVIAICRSQGILLFGEASREQGS